MGIKIHEMGKETGMLAFHCPGCEYGHAFNINTKIQPCWGWNGSLDKPTFTPSLLINKDNGPSRCHSFVKDGMIQFLGDSFHKLANQTVELPDWD